MSEHTKEQQEFIKRADAQLQLHCQVICEFDSYDHRLPIEHPELGHALAKLYNLAISIDRKHEKDR